LEQPVTVRKINSAAYRDWLFRCSSGADHPATQSWKRRRLAGLGVEPPARHVFAPVDF